MVQVKYDISLPVIGRYNGKRKEIIINPRLNTPLKTPVTLFHESLHHIINITSSPKVLNKVLDYVAYGHKYFSSFQEYRRCKRYDVMFRIADVEFDKLGLELSEIRDGQVIFVPRKELSDKESKKVSRRFDHIWLLRKEAIRLSKS